MPANLTEDESSHFFDVFYKFDSVKVIFALYFWPMVLWGSGLFYALIWFECYSVYYRYSNLLNQLSGNFLIVVVFNSTGYYIVQPMLVRFVPIAQPYLHLLLCYHYWSGLAVFWIFSATLHCFTALLHHFHMEKSRCHS